jgi:hypothetical protein
MDNPTRTILRSLELQNEAKAQDLSIAYQRISDLEQQVENLTNTDPTYATPESQVDFIRKVAASRTKFSKEAQDIIDAIETPLAAPVDPNA